MILMVLIILLPHKRFITQVIRLDSAVRGFEMNCTLEITALIIAESLSYFGFGIHDKWSAASHGFV